MTIQELDDNYKWKTDYIIIDYEPIIYINKVRTEQSLEEQYIKHIEETKVLLIIKETNKINLCKTGNNKLMALHLFDSLTKHIATPQIIKQVEADYIANASQGALIFNTKDYKGSYHKYDIKSAYPSIMKSVQLFPVKEGEFKQVTQKEFDNYTFYPFGIFRCKIKYDENYKKLFRFSDKNYYTHIDLTRAKELNLNVELIIDEQANFCITQEINYWLVQKYLVNILIIALI